MSCFASYGQAEQLELTFELLQNDNIIAIIHETFTQTDNQYTIQSITKGEGVYALLGERKLLSKGLVNAQGLQPSYFESTQSLKPKKTLRSMFDWQNAKLDLEIKGKHEIIPLPVNAVDMLSAMYQFAWRKLRPGNISVWITNGKKLSRQQYTVTSETTPIATKAGHFNVFKLTHQDKTLYVSKNAPFIVVKAEMLVDGIPTQQLLSTLKVSK